VTFSIRHCHSDNRFFVESHGTILQFNAFNTHYRFALSRRREVSISRIRVSIALSHFAGTPRG